MNRRSFLKAAGATLALGSVPRYAEALADTHKRVGLTSAPAGYGKSDLFRLIQVAPVEVVSLCDVDSGCWPMPPRMVASRQASKKTPRTFSTTARCSARGPRHRRSSPRPDHWHALPMIEAAKAGADIYVQKPISVDVAEGQAMLAAARKHQRVVQVGMQRRSTPHLITARDRIIREGKLGQGRRCVEIYCYYHMRATREPAGHRGARLPRLRDVDRARADAALQRARSSSRAGAPSWSTATASSATCACTCSTWCAGCWTSGMPTRISSSGGILVDKASKANITDTQTATFDYPAACRSSGRTARGATRPIRNIRGAPRSTATRARSRPACMGYDFVPGRRRDADSRGRDATSSSSIRRTRRKKDLERHVAPAIRGHMKNLLQCIETRETPGLGHRAGLHLGDGVHPGQPVAEARAIADVGPRARGCRRRRRGQRAAEASVSRPHGCIRRPRIFETGTAHAARLY